MHDIFKRYLSGMDYRTTTIENDVVIIKKLLRDVCELFRSTWSEYDRCSEGTDQLVIRLNEVYMYIDDLPAPMHKELLDRLRKLLVPSGYTLRGLDQVEKCVNIYVYINTYKFLMYLPCI